MRLTKKNYFTPKNTYLSGSKIKDYLTDPAYFNKLHITHELVKEATPAMRLGTAVDIFLTGGQAKFHKTYTRACLKKDDPLLYAENQATTKTVLTQAEYDKAILMAEAVKMSPAWEITRKARKQVLLKMDLDGLGIWQGIAGILDFLQISKDGETATITDLKTTASVDPFKFHYTCLDYNYYLSMAVYSMLVIHNYPNVKTVIVKFLAVESDKSNPFVGVFEVDQEYMQEQYRNVMDIVEMIASDKEFISKNKSISWDKPVILPIIRD